MQHRWWFGLLTAILIASLAPGTTGLASVAGTGPLRVYVVDDRDQPVAGARVELLAARLGLVATATTATDGTATLRPWGAVTGLWLRVWADGQAVTEQAWEPAATGRSLTVRLSGLRGQLRGFVAATTSLPLSGVRVSAWHPDLGLAGSTQTSPDGTYVLRNLVPGEYRLEFEQRGFEPQVASVQVTADHTTHTDTTLPAARATVAGTVVAAGSGLPVDAARVELVRAGWGVVASATTGGGGGRFQLTAAPAETAEYTLQVTAAEHVLLVSEPFALPPGVTQEFSGDRRLELTPLYGSVWGYILKADGTPVPGAAMELQLRDTGTVDTATTDDTGFFSFDRVLPGTYRVRSFPGRSWSASDSDWLTITAGEQRSVRINPVLYTQQSHGVGTVAGSVSAGGAQPVAEATVTLRRGDTVVATTTTDAWGRYTFTDVAGSAGFTPRNTPITTTGYIVQVTAPGYLPTDQPVGGPAGELAVHAGALTEAIFRLQAAGLGIGGRILDDFGQPLAGVTVSLFQEGRADPIHRLTSGPGGHYRFPDQAVTGGGGFFVTAAQDGYFPAVPSPVLTAAGAPAGHLEANLVLRPAETQLQGTITNTQGEVLAGAKVTVLSAASGRSHEVTTGANGRFSLAGLAAGPADHYLVRATAAGATTAAASTAITPAGQRAATVHLTIAPAAAVAGVVRNSQGEPLPGVVVELHREGSATPVARTTTDAGGRYRFADLMPGTRYGVLARGEGYVTSPLAPGEAGLTPLLTTIAGTTARRDISLQPTR